MNQEATFRLEDDFIKSYVNKHPNWGPIGYVTYKRTYARPIDTLPERYRLLADQYDVSGTEEWWLTVLRVVEGTYRIQEVHCSYHRLHWDKLKAYTSAKEMFELIFSMKFLPPGRGLWMMGTDYIVKNGGAALNNCGFTTTENIDKDFADPFCFLMDMSMLGVGVGGDTRGAGKVTIQTPLVGLPHVVEDSREGWVSLIRRILNSYVGKATMPDNIDFSQVRKNGEKINGFGGTASGPGPLEEAVEYITALLDSRIGELIKSTDIVDIFNFLGRCVVSGNVRRSAEIMFGDSNDLNFLNLKNKEMFPEEVDHHRWVSNNSVFAEVGQDYSELAKLTATNGEPGYFWLDNARLYSRMGHPADGIDSEAKGGNPCLEQTLWPYELCCLVETFPSLHESYEEYKRTLKFAYLYAKTVTLLSTHDTRTNAVLLKNRRIGTSMTGIVQAMNKHGKRQMLNWCNKGYKYLRNLDSVYSDWLAIPKSIKITSVKPSGTVSLLPGVTPGVHFPHSMCYNRVIRFKSDSPMLPHLRKAGYRCIELDHQKEPDTTAVYFPVKEKHFEKSKSEVTMWEQLELAAQLQQWWADNQVSVTVSFKKSEAKDIVSALEYYETRLKGVSFLPLKNHGYEHAPYQEITEEEYEEAIKNIVPVTSFNGSARNEMIDKFCDGESCAI